MKIEITQAVVVKESAWLPGNTLIVDKTTGEELIERGVAKLATVDAPVEPTDTVAETGKAKKDKK